ncbi:MAG: pentapeptide repeat-containing protein [Kineosporiaceae bacterium]
MTAGPTQNYERLDGEAWRPHPWLARGIRASIAVLPAASAIGFGLVMHTQAPPTRLEVNPWVWMVGVLTVSWLLLWVLTAALTRLLPLSVLMRLSLVFPDEAPSRFKVAMRAGNSREVERQIAWIRSSGRALDVGEAAAEQMLALVAALSAHDRLTRGHSERVRAYADLIIEEMGLSPAEAARARWAALLHDVGKLMVPAEILNKRGRPTPREWQVLARHPDEGMRLVAPVLDWLGEWAAGIGQHHERWDGRGYPRGLAGEDIHLSARIIAVADTFDVITSHRSYKKPISATAARAEIIRCAGTQFDPVVVRAFLRVGLGRLRVVTGPLSLLASLPPLRQLPVGELVHGVATASVATTAAVVSSAGIVGVPAADESPATTRPPVAAATHPRTGGAKPRTPAVQGGRRPATQARATTKRRQAPAARTIAPKAAPPAPRTTAAVAPLDALDPDRDLCRQVRAGTGAFAGADLRDCDLSGMRFTSGTFHAADLRGADLSGASITSTDLGEARLDGAKLSGAALANGSATGASLRGADLSGSAITQMSLTGANLTGADLSRSRLSQVEFGQADLSKADLTGAALSHCGMQGADLGGATLTGVTLDQTTLPSA